MRSERLQLSVSADRSYLPHVATMLHSATRVPGQPPLEVHLLHDTDVGDDDLAPLESMLAGGGALLSALAVDPARLSDLSRSHFSITAWYRVLLPELLPHVERVIHIDGDALVKSSLEPLWAGDLEGAPFGAVQNPLYPWMRPGWERLGLPPGTPYLNSGVLLLDLDRLRGADAVERLLFYGARHPENPWPEQDALTAVFHGGWKDLHPRWNLQTTVSELDPQLLPWPTDVVIAARRDPAIIHCSGPLKPWEGWGARGVVRDYLCHRRASGYPMDAEPRRQLVASVLPHLPLRVRRRVMVRALRHRRRS